MSANWCRRSGPRTDCAPFHLSQARSAAVADLYSPLTAEHDQGVTRLWTAVLEAAQAIGGNLARSQGTQTALALLPGCYPSVTPGPFFRLLRFLIGR